MKKLLLTAAVAVCFSMPAFAADEAAKVDAAAGVSAEAVAVDAAAAAVAAPADAAKEMADATFKAIDGDADGKITAAEHAAYFEKMFAAADANADGSVSLDEMVAAQAHMAGEAH